MNVRVDSVRRRDVLMWWLVGVLGAVGVWALAAWTPSTAQEDTVCLLRRTTGLACPGFEGKRGVPSGMVAVAAVSTRRHKSESESVKALLFRLYPLYSL